MLLQIFSVLVLMISTALCMPDGVRQNMMRLARDNKPQKSSGTFDNLLRVDYPYTSEKIPGSMDRDTLHGYQSGEVLRVLEAIERGDLLSSLDSEEQMAVQRALEKKQTGRPKPMLDSMSGWAFGESKRGGFDVIDHAGSPKRSSPLHSLRLAKKNFDEIDRAGFETYNKRNFDEIDNVGFMGFEKRHGKD